MRPRVFITQPVAAGAIERLRAAAEVRLNPDPLHIMAKDELIDAVRSSDILFCLLHDGIDADVIRANPKLLAVASMTITPANIDVAEATARRIPVTVTPRALLDDSTADIAFALLLAVGRRLVEADRLVRAGTVPGSQSSHLEARGVSGRTLGILGMGGVGRAMARRARGPIVDEQALVPALRERRIAGAGLDVYENEPHINPAFAAMPNVALTPHMGSAVAQVREATANAVVDNILAILEGRRPPNCYNEEIYAARA